MPSHGYDEQSFSADVIERFGNVEPDLEADRNLLHCQMATLAALVERDTATAGGVLSFLEAVLRRPDAISEIENAVAISFLEWPALEARKEWVSLAPRAADIVQKQWEREQRR